MASLGGGELPIIGRIQESKQTPVRGSMENSICSIDILGPALFGTYSIWSHIPQSLNPQDYIFLLVTHAILKNSCVISWYTCYECNVLFSLFKLFF